jgi:hypothetical protein
LFGNNAKQGWLYNVEGMYLVKFPWLLFFAKIEGWRPLAARAYFPLAKMICKLSPTQGENNQ